jgi:integrase
MFGRIRPVDDLAADDFEMLRADIAKQWGPVRLGNEVQRVRTVFKYGYESGLFDKPVRYGPQFRKPGAAVLRKHRAANGKRMFEASDLRRLLKVAPTQLKAMILLGINCGFGNHDCATLPLAALDLTGAWLDYPRPKTGIARRCSLWPDTVAALQAALSARPVAKDAAAGLVFVTKHHGSWGADGNTSAITHEFRDLLNGLALHRVGLGFYSLRHTFRTVADSARDQVAANFIMGHADATMAGVYRERMDDSRLKAVADFVHAWLFRESPEPGNAKPSRPMQRAAG